MVTLSGKIIIIGEIRAETGLHIGGSTVGLDIGGVDNAVIRDKITDQPYIPGSSLKGKMRSLLEKATGKEPNTDVGKVKIHQCKSKEDFANCKVCKIFGLPGEKPFSQPTRLFVRDSFLSDPESLEKADTDLPYTEVKFENVIDRITSAANPRQTERVPAGAKFGFEFIYNVFNEEDKNNLKYVFEAMNLLEHDYLGGQGSRGYGKIKFSNIKILWNSRNDYENGTTEIKTKEPINNGYNTVDKILQNWEKKAIKI
ncbi:MAG: type III-A CRISPR-associated RAMP protein Csm3 [Methanosarcinales archaeon]